jgi:hypothetical protein
LAQPRRRSARTGCHASLTDGAELVIKLQRCELDPDGRDGRRVRSEAFPHGVERGQPAGIEFRVDRLGELDLAGALMGERQKPDHRAAGALFGVSGEQRLEGAP